MWYARCHTRVPYYNIMYDFFLPTNRITYPEQFNNNVHKHNTIHHRYSAWNESLSTAILTILYTLQYLGSTDKIHRIVASILDFCKEIII